MQYEDVLFVDDVLRFRWRAAQVVCFRVSSARVSRHRPAAGSRLVGDDPKKLLFYFIYLFIYLFVLEIKLAADAYFEGRNEKKRGEKKRKKKE
jgi:hypothetical protein